MNIFLIAIPIIIILVIVLVFIFLKKKKNKKENQDVFEEIPINTSQELMDGPIEPLGNTIIDKEFEGLPNETPTSTVEMTPEEIKPVFDLNIDNPLTAQEKGALIPEEKEEEVETKIDIFKECPVCHTKVEPNATTCFLCGSKLD